MGYIDVGTDLNASNINFFKKEKIPRRHFHSALFVFQLRFHFKMQYSKKIFTEKEKILLFRSLRK